MNSLLYYYNNVQKMAAYRQAKRMQRGAMLGENQAVTGSTTSKFVSNPITIGTDDFSVEFYGTMYGSNSSYASLFNAASPSAGGDKTFSFYSQYYPNNGIYGVLFSPDTSGDSLGDQVLVQYEPGDDSKFLVTLTRQGTTVNVYINGELKATKEQSEVKDLGDLQLAIANSSDVGFVRVWNMCLSADDVTDHYNNGDPMGYVVPKAMRELTPIQIIGENSYTWTGSDDPTYGFYVRITITDINKRYKVNYTISNYESGDPFIFTDNYYTVPKENGTYDVIVEYSSPHSWIIIYGGPSGLDRRLTITVNSITPVGLLAEFLPQNLMYGRDDKTIATSWLDSAKQLPLSDEYMEPLFQSIGGYDMAANGAPEILYNE